MHITEPWTMHGGGMYTLNSDCFHSSFNTKYVQEINFPPYFCVSYIISACLLVPLFVLTGNSSLPFLVSRSPSNRQRQKTK